MLMNTDILFPDLNEYNYNPMNDVLFKFIFGKEERKQITLDFLNAVLESSLGHVIEDLTFAPSEMSPEHEGDKLTRLDVACVLDSGEQIDVEVQVVNEKNMERRTLFYWAQMYLMSLPAGKLYTDLKPAITINLLNFSFLPQAEPHAMYSIYNPVNGHQLTKDLMLHFLEIPKYAKESRKPIAKMTKMERWLAYFANQLDKNGKEELAMSEAAIQNAMDAARVFFSSTAERRRYINRELIRMDQESGLISAHQEGRAQEAQCFGKLIQILIKEGNLDKIQEVTNDTTLRESLYKKYHIE